MTDPSPRVQAPSDRRADPRFAALLLDSYRRLVGVDLCPPVWASDAEAAQWLYEKAPFVLLAHDASADPLFLYANRTAQRAFGYTWDEFIGLPSRLSAAPDAQEDRDALLASVNEHGYADGYQGLRRHKEGRIFRIEDVRMWNLEDSEGTRHGQAAVFHPSAGSGPSAVEAMTAG
ncbi:MEKHLA domain-containing protein [Actinacidiphila sp. bgisy160]|uniref:MEKHLA domain-containing protein n=1 Tax=Actinacidiphila sp. bgisy160 TaxID=3413796 RepID=UPI003D713650